MPDIASSDLQQDRRLIETITYLASLSSSMRDIDPMLDPLRLITLRWHETTPLEEPDRQELKQLEYRLRNYLITSDPLRDFTEASLEERVNSHLNGDKVQRPWLGFAGVLILAAFVAAAVLAIPYTPSLATRALLASPAFLFVGLLGVIWFYLSSLTNFKQELRQAFVWLCLGTTVLGMFFMHFVFVQILEMSDRQLFRYGGLLALATLAVMCMYRGLVLYARLLQHDNLFTSAQNFAAALAVAVSSAATIATARQVPEPFYFGFSMACLISLTVTAGFSAMVGRAIYRDTSVTYRASIRWLYVFMASTFFGSIAYGTAIVVLGQLSGTALSVALACFAIPPVLLLLYSGYSFKVETSR